MQQGDAEKGDANKRNATACIHLVVLSPWWTNGPKKQFEMNTPCVFCLEEKKIKLWIFLHLVNRSACMFSVEKV